MLLPDYDAIRHRWYEDILGLCRGVLLCWLGLHIFATLGLFTGQVEGLAMLFSLITDVPFGVWFVTLSLPFYVFGFRKMGARFTFKMFGQRSGAFCFIPCPDIQFSHRVN